VQKHYGFSFATTLEKEEKRNGKEKRRKRSSKKKAKKLLPDLNTGIV
jgi:hypothetical protein